MYNIHWYRDNVGKVGIGAANPGSKLSVSGCRHRHPNGALGSTGCRAGLALEIIGTASGRILFAQDTLASSGTLVVRGVSTFKQNISLPVLSRSRGHRHQHRSLLVVDNKGLVYDGTNSASASDLLAGRGDPLEVVGTISGSSLRIGSASSSR